MACSIVLLKNSVIWVVKREDPDAIEADFGGVIGETSTEGPFFSDTPLANSQRFEFSDRSTKPTGGL